MKQETLAALLEDALNANERQQLEAQLAQDDELAAEAVDQLRMAALLGSLLAPETRRQAVARSVQTAIAAPALEQVQSRIVRDVAGSMRRAWWRRRATAWTLATAAAAACLLLIMQAWKTGTTPPVSVAAGTLQLAELSGEATVARAAQSLPATRQMQLMSGDVLRLATDARATVVLPDGSRCELSDAAELVLHAADGRQLELARGRMQVAAQQQPAEQPLLINTSLAKLRVLGTVFAVQAAARQTRLDVNEGLVRVDHAQQASAVEVAAGEFAIAVPQAELVAGVLPTAATVRRTGAAEQFVRRPFSDDSPWNQPLGRDARYADLQAPALDLVGHGAVIQPAAHMRPLWLARADDPATVITSRYTDEEFARVPAPPDMLRGRREWVVLTLIDTTQATAVELFAAQSAEGRLAAMHCAPIDLRGRGVPPETSGQLYSGLPAVGGLIRAGELQQGIKHVLGVAVLHAGLNRHAGNGQPFVWPARHMPIELHKLEQFGATGNVCYGTRLAIPRNVDLAALDLSAPGRALAQALQDYGAFVTHSYPRAPQDGGGWKQPHLQFFADEPMEGTDWRQLAAEASKLAAQLKVVTP